MTGDDIKALRKAVDFSAALFAQLCGVDVSTLYRWERSPAPHVEPLQREILDHVARFIAKYKPPAQTKKLLHLRGALTLGGTVEAIATLAALTRGRR